MSNSGSKFKLIVGRNLPHPAKCFSCGRTSKHENDVFVDFKRSIDFYGAVLYCIDCSQGMARTIEYGPLAEKAVVEADLVGAITQRDYARSKMEEVFESVRNLLGDAVADNLRASVSDDDTDVASDESPAEEADSVAAEFAKRIADSDSGS